MPRQKYDAVVVGAGSRGEALSIRREGYRVDRGVVPAQRGVAPTDYAHVPTRFPGCTQQVLHDLPVKSFGFGCGLNP